MAMIAYFDMLENFAFSRDEDEGSESFTIRLCTGRWVIESGS
jgi:hypothetical protein